MSALVLTSSTMGVFAGSFSYPGTVKGDGIRLRRQPDYGTTLELMYDGERVHVDKEMTDASGAAYYLKRDKTGTVGYAAFEYIKLDYSMY